jgi:hypothetical protein
MTRQQLVNMFPDERTAHLPADGKPLARFEEARREILAAGGMVMGEAGTGSAESGTGRRSLWAALFGGGEESDEDMAEANTMATDGWIDPSATPRAAPSAPVVASAPPPAPVASAPVAAAPTPAPTPAPAAPPPAIARLAPQAITSSPLAIVSPPLALPASPTMDAAIPLPIARPRDLGTGAATLVAAAAPAERPAEPQLVWQQGPSGQQTASSGEADGRQIVAELPLPPRRPGSSDSIGSLVTAFASTSSGGSNDALARLGITPPVGLRGGDLRGGVTPPENAAVVPAILPPRREIVAAPVAQAAAAVAANSTESQPRVTASIVPRAPARNVIAIARDEGAALRSLFVDRASTAPSTNTPARIAVARVRRDQPAPSGFVAVSGSGLTQGFSKEPRAAMSTSVFAGPAVAPLQLRR